MFFFPSNLSFVWQKDPSNIHCFSFGDCFWVSIMTKKRDCIYLFLCFSLNSISLLFHRNNHWTSTAFRSAIVFGSYVFLCIQSLFCLTKWSLEHPLLFIRGLFLGFYNDKKERLNIFSFWGERQVPAGAAAPLASRWSDPL